MDGTSPGTGLREATAEGYSMASATFPKSSGGKWWAELWGHPPRGADALQDHPSISWAPAGAPDGQNKTKRFSSERFVLQPSLPRSGARKRASDI